MSAPILTDDERAALRNGRVLRVTTPTSTNARLAKLAMALDLSEADVASAALLRGLSTLAQDDE